MPLWLTAALAFLRGLVSDWLARMERDRIAKDAGRLEAESEAKTNLEQKVPEIEADQKQNDSVDRGGAAGVLDRLRKSGGA
jgi:hypothetical protein